MPKGHSLVTLAKQIRSTPRPHHAKPEGRLTDRNGGKVPASKATASTRKGA
jgi:hypothetical protein